MKLFGDLGDIGILSSIHPSIKSGSDVCIFVLVHFHSWVLFFVFFEMFFEHLFDLFVVNFRCKFLAEF